MTSAQPDQATPRLDLVGVVVSDMAASLAFYRALGLELPAGDDQPHVETTLPGGLRLAFDTEDTVRSFDPHWTRPSGGNRVELAFHCGKPEAVDARYHALTEAGYQGHLRPWDAFWGQRYAVVRDPDGNGVSLFAPLESAGASATGPLEGGVEGAG
ncbi:VOC family protein [Streptomyces sp. NPDC006879]|uniref:VOC family protein n=1 Tax=Streptomyces sp. NPDC006879 TaxID=3364767 RepID=UPI0036C25880